MNYPQKTTYRAGFAACVMASFLALGAALSSPASANLKIKPPTKSAYSVTVYYMRELDNTSIPVSPSALLRMYEAKIVFDLPRDVAEIKHAVMQVRIVKRVRVPINARWAVVFSRGQSFFVSPQGLLRTSEGITYSTDNSLLLFLRKKLSCVRALVAPK